MGGRLSSPLTKWRSADSLRLWRFGRVIGDCDGAGGGGSGGPDGDVGGDAALAGTCVLRLLQEVLLEAGFDAFVEGACKPYYAPRMGAPSLPPGRYFRMHMIGYFEGIDSERGIAWRCADWFSLREFLRLSNREKAPDHSWLSRTRSRLPHEAHEKVFGWVLKLVASAAGEGRADRRRRVDDGGQRRVAHDRAARHGRELSRDAHADGARERRRDADGRGPGALRPQAQGQDAVERGLEEPDRP